MGDVVSGIFGGSESAGLLGTGQFKAKEYNINDAAFDPAKLKSYQQEQAARTQQNQFIGMLQNQAQGIGPSLAQQQLKMGTDRGIAQQMGAAASQRGANPAMAARMAMQNVAGINQQGAADAAMIREQEKINAMGQLGAQIGNMRSGDLAATDRDLSAKMGRESLGVQQQTGLNNTNAGAYEGASKRRGDFVSGIGAALGVSDENKKTEIKDGSKKTKGFLERMSESMDKQRGVTPDNPASGQYGSGKAIGAGIAKLFSGGESAAPAAAAASDEKNKKDVKSGDKKSEGFLNAMRSALGRPTVDEEKQKQDQGKSLGTRIGESIFKAKEASAAESSSDENNKTKKGSGKGELQGFLDAIGAHSYEYKDKMKDNPLAGEGEFVSPMAQELEKTDIGKSMVMDTPDGKVVDYGKGFGAILAAQAMLNDRLNKIEKRKGS